MSDHTPSSLTPPPSSGLNSINFLLSASQSAAGLSLPTLALPYVLLPSYPVAPGDAHPSPLGFLSQANFLMGAAGPYGHPGAELGVTLAPPPQSKRDDVAKQQPLVRQPPVIVATRYRSQSESSMRCSKRTRVNLTNQETRLRPFQFYAVAMVTVTVKLLLF